MRINLYCIGKTDDDKIISFLEYYEKRLPKHWNFEIIEIPELKNTKNLSQELIKKEEAKLILSNIQNGDYTILMDEKGKQFSSREFADKINSWMNFSYRKINLVIGGAYGFSDDVYQMANEKISLSKMTFTHQMIRLFLLEQLYRANQILLGKPYHHD